MKLIRKIEDERIRAFWTVHTLSCNECLHYVNAVVQLNEDDEHPMQICKDCLEKALILIKEEI